MKTLLTFLTLIVGFSAFAGDYQRPKLPKKYVVVPNRSDSSVTILSTPKGDILRKITRSDTGFEFEPIYASSIPRFKMIAVSDRKNSQLIFFDNESLKYLGAVPASNGMFHMWPTPEQKEIFAVADIDRVVDALEINRFGDEVVYKPRKINPGALFDSGKPHDVVVDKTHVYVTMIGVDEPNGMKADYVLKYDRKTLQLQGKMKFSFDIHLGIPEKSPYLLVVEQTAGRLNYIDKKTFTVKTYVEDLYGAHGVYWNPDASKVYLANFISRGPMSLYEVRQMFGTDEFISIVTASSDLPDAKAHNVTVDFENQVMFVTHSGPNHDGNLNTNVSVFSTVGDMKFIKTVETGVNPLGILLVER